VQALGQDVTDSESLAAFVARFAREVGRDIVLLIDDVDKSSNSQVFLSFLGLLRQEYLLRTRATTPVGCRGAPGLPSRSRETTDATAAE